MRTIQKRFRDQLEARHCKVLLLEAYWDKMIHHIGKIATKKKDIHVKRVLNEILKVPEKIRYEMLKRYV